MNDSFFLENLLQHDRYRFEIKIKLKEGFLSDHIFEYYFFIPSSLNISYLTYSKENFYSSIQRYIRYSTPNMQINQLFSLDNSLSPYFRVVKEIDHIKENNNYLVNTIVDELKLIGMIIKDKISEVLYLSDFDKKVSEILSIKSVFFEAFSTLSKKIHSFNCPLQVKKAFISVDEYVTLILLESISKIIQENEFDVSKKKVLFSLAKDIYEYRKNQGYFYPDRSRRDYFLYYRGVLKKFVSSCLFLDIEPAFNIYLHIAGGVASASAMLFAVLIMIYAQTKYSITSGIFVFIAVVSYVFKDRIKELVKILFMEKATFFVYDRKIKIKEPSHNISIGYIKESFFILNPKSVEDDIKKERQKLYSIVHEDLSNETIIKYKKVIKIDHDKIAHHHTRKRDLVDIIRFSIYDFLKHSDDERIDYPIYSDGGFKKEVISKNYLLNIVVRYIHGGEKFYERYKIVFNRSGIIDLERV